MKGISRNDDDGKESYKVFGGREKNSRGRKGVRKAVKRGIERILKGS